MVDVFFLAYRRGKGGRRLTLLVENRVTILQKILYENCEQWPAATPPPPSPVATALLYRDLFC